MSTLHVELLTKAREEIDDPDYREGICNALDLVTPAGRDEYRAMCDIKDHISALLCLGIKTPHFSTCLESWLHEVHGVPTKRLRQKMPASELDGWLFGITYYRPTKKLIATRLAWIDWLIEEWRDAP